MTADDDLVLHLPLDRLREGGFDDRSNTRRSITAIGTVAVLADSAFGTCAQFTGSDTSRIVIAKDSAMRDSDQLTIAAWIALSERQSRPAKVIGIDRASGANWGLLYSAKGLQFVTPAATGTLELPFELQVDAWYHVSGVLDDLGAVLYVHDLQGVLLANASMDRGKGSFATGAIILGGDADSAGHVGRMAAVRVYRRGLGQAEIRACIEEDRLGQRAFSASHPVDFRLHDSHGQPVLPITDLLAHEAMELRLRNLSGETIQLGSADVHHFSLRFRQGVLSDAVLNGDAGLGIGPAKEWKVEVACGPDEPGGSLRLYLGDKKELKAGESLVVEIHGLSAAPGSGARGTTVELAPNNVKYLVGGAPVSGVRTQYLHVTNQLGRKHLPVHAMFVGNDTVMNDGEADGNDLTLRIFNVSKDTNIALEGSLSARPTKFYVAFDVQLEKGDANPAALCEQGYVEEIEPTPDSGCTTNRPTKEAPVCEITWTEGKVLKPGESFGLQLTGIKTKLPAGLARFVIRYENVPGYWDGHLACRVERTPIRVVEGKIGIGAGKPAYDVDIRGADTVGLAAGGVGGGQLILSKDGLQLEKGDRPRVRAIVSDLADNASAASESLPTVSYLDARLAPPPIRWKGEGMISEPGDYVELALPVKQSDLIEVTMNAMSGIGNFAYRILCRNNAAKELLGGAGICRQASCTPLAATGLFQAPANLTLSFYLQVEQLKVQDSREPQILAAQLIAKVLPNR